MHPTIALLPCCTAAMLHCCHAAAALLHCHAALLPCLTLLSSLIVFPFQGGQIARFSCVVNSTSEPDIRAIWDAIGVKAAVGEIQEHNKRIHFYAEVPRDKRQYPEKFKSLIEERGVKIQGNVNYCSAGVSRAAAAYWAVEKGDGIKFYHRPDNFNKDVIKNAQKLKYSPESEPSAKGFENDSGSSSVEYDGACSGLSGQKRLRLQEDDIISISRRKIARQQDAQAVSFGRQAIQEEGIGNAELARKIDQLLEEQRQTREENRKILQLITLQGGKLDGIASSQTETNQAIQEITNSQDETSKAVQGLASSHSMTDLQLALHAGKLQTQMQEMELGLEQMSADLQTVAVNHIDSAFLASHLEETTRERDAWRSTAQSQAGKMAAVSKGRNEAQRENAELKADKEKSIQLREAINEVVERISRQVRRDVRRSETRLASHLDIQDQPLGDPQDNYPYDQFPQDENISEFMAVLEATYKKASPLVKRHELPLMDDFPVAALSRKYYCDIAAVLKDPENDRNLAKSPAKHRLELMMLSGTMTHKYWLDYLRDCFEIITKWCSERTSVPYAQDHTTYPMMDDPFHSSEVRFAFTHFPTPLCDFSVPGEKLDA